MGWINTDPAGGGGSGVSSFATRTGAVVPEAGDYAAYYLSALPVTVTANTTIFQDTGSNPLFATDSGGGMAFSGGAITIGSNQGSAAYIDESGNGYVFSLSTPYGLVIDGNGDLAGNSLNVGGGLITLGETGGTAAYIDDFGNAFFAGDITFDGNLTCVGTYNNPVIYRGSFYDASDNAILLVIGATTGDTAQLQNTAVNLIDYTTINSPVDGMLAYNFTLHKAVVYSSGTSTWQTVTST